MNLTAGELIKHCRKFRGMTQQELADKAGISKDIVCRYERGKYEPKYQCVLWCLEACGFELEIKELKHHDAIKD